MQPPIMDTAMATALILNDTRVDLVTGVGLTGMATSPIMVMQAVMQQGAATNRGAAVSLWMKH